MVLGFSKIFVIFLVIAIVLGIVTHNYWNGIVLIIFFSFVKIVWNILT